MRPVGYARRTALLPTAHAKLVWIHHPFQAEGFIVTTTFHSTRSTNDSLTAKQAIRKCIADDLSLIHISCYGMSDVLNRKQNRLPSISGGKPVM